MALVRYPPNTIHLGGDMVEVGDLAAGAVITPGMLIERYNSSGTALWRHHSTASVATAPAFALNQSMLNKGVNDTYGVGDLVQAAIGSPGSTFWARIASGQNIVTGAKLESAGDGTLKVYATGVPLATALESKNATGGAQMIRVEVL